MTPRRSLRGGTGVSTTRRRTGTNATIDRVGAVGYYVGATLVRRDAGASWAYSDRKDDSEAGEALIYFADAGSWWNPLVSS